MNYKDTHVIVLNGPPSCGKDTLGDTLLQLYPGTIMSLRFAQVLKDGAHRLLGLQCPTEAYNSFKDEPHEDFFGMKPRDFYIQLSEQFMKTRFGSDIFGHLWVREYERLMGVYEIAFSAAGMATAINPPMLVITDCGFGDELLPLKAYFGKDRLHLLQIHRDGCDFSDDSRGYIDATWADIECDKLINPNDNVDEYIKNAMAILEDRGVLAQL